jgi:PPOX class probable F420-dependent enzyme
MDVIERPAMPDGYGIARDGDGTLPWSWVEERLAASRSYWVCTTRADGRPHAMPVWGLWLADRLVFSTDPSSTKGRNLAARPDVVVHLESGDEVVVVEGRAERMSADLIPAYRDAYDAKYAYRPEPDAEATGCYQVVPERVLAWRESDFPTSATRFRRTLPA